MIGTNAGGFPSWDPLEHLASFQIKQTKPCADFPRCCRSLRAALFELLSELFILRTALSFLCGVIPSPLFKLLSLFCHDDPITFPPDILSARGEQCSALGTRGPARPAGSASTLLPRKSAPWDAGWWLHPACSSAWKRMLFLSHLRVHIMGGTDSIQWEYTENSLEGRSMR